MNLTITPNKLHGNVLCVPSKSQAHRMIICAALSSSPTQIEIPSLCDDVLATIGCMTALGADIHLDDTGFLNISPIHSLPGFAELDCRESGSTLRFLLPIVAALGVEARFILSGLLPNRPLSPLWDELERHGCKLTKSKNEIYLWGKLLPGDFRMDGSVSSQFISGLMMALPLVDGDCTLTIDGKVESAPYIALTQNVLSSFGCPDMKPMKRYSSPGKVCVEGDWSNAAFWLGANALGSSIALSNLNDASMQGDKVAISLMRALAKGNVTIDGANIPDLIPILAVVATANHGATFTNIHRLRLKESDRVKAIESMLRSLGGKCSSRENTITVYPSCFVGGTLDSFQDHRIAMAAAIASTICTENVTILDAECVQKSYPNFWNDFARLGGKL